LANQDHSDYSELSSFQRVALAAAKDVISLTTAQYDCELVSGQSERFVRLEVFGGYTLWLYVDGASLAVGEKSFMYELADYDGEMSMVGALMEGLSRALRGEEVSGAASRVRVLFEGDEL